MPDLLVRSDINVRSTRYFLAFTGGTCWHCQAATRLFALGLPPGHQTLDLDDDELDREDTTRSVSEGRWSIASCNALLFYTDYLPELVQSRLRGVTQSYRFGYCKATASSYWANHCERCDSLLDDHELFCEPEGAFLPTTEASAALIHLVPIDESIEAAAAGYAFEPAFFDAMSRGDAMTPGSHATTQSR